jgi:predicted AlkP superfamily phosphohydrolase/phosphomutase
MAVDEPVTAVLALVLPSALLVLAAASLSRRTGLLVAIVLPFLWLALFVNAQDSPTLWLVPVVAAVAVLGAEKLGRIPRARPQVALGALIFLVVALAMPLPVTIPDSGTRLVLIGIDGATWERVDALVEHGRLPHISALLEDGHRARLRSLDIMSSPRIWSSIATGCVPDVHGIIDWGGRQSDFRVGRLWDELLAEGRSVGVLNWYFTWPPPDRLEDPSFIIPSSMAPDNATSPPEYSFLWNIRAREGVRGRSDVAILPNAVSAVRHGVRISTLRRSAASIVGRKFGVGTRLDHASTGRKLSMAIQTDVFAELVRTRRPEFAAVLLNQVDYVSHFYWKYSTPGLFPEVSDEDAARYGKMVDEIYLETDRCLAKILSVLPDGADVMIVSDHGFRPATGKTAGYYCRIRTERLIEVLGMEDVLFGTNLGSEVWLRPASGSPEEGELLLAGLEEILAVAHLVTEAGPLFAVKRDGPSLVLRMRERDAIPEDASIGIAGKSYAFDELVAARPEAHISGEHAPDGVYLLAGPHTALATRVDSLSVLDVAPTVAAILEMPISPLWTGRAAVATESPIVRPVALYATPRTATESPAPPDEHLKSQLRALGYLE